MPATSRLDADATRVEIRCPDPSCNPYLAFAVMLRAGLDGIERELPLADPVEENLTGFEPAMLEQYNVRSLPTSLEEALQALRQDDVICDALGPQVLERFLEAKEIEWEEYRKQVTPWELERYFSVY